MDPMDLSVLEGEIVAVEDAIELELEFAEFDENEMWMPEIGECIKKLEELKKELMEKLRAVKAKKPTAEQESSKEVVRKIAEKMKELRKLMQKLKESVNETGEENDKIAKQKAREVTDAEASAKKDDKIMKQKAREVTDAAASAEKDEENDKIVKQKAREVKNAEASAKKNDEENDKIVKQKAREVKNAEASAKYEETSQKLVSEAQYGKELKNEFAGMKNAVASMKAKHKVDIDLKNTKIEELKEQIKTSNANNKANKSENKVEEKSENEKETTNIDDNAEMKTNDINNDSSDQVKDLVKKVEERIAIAKHGKAEKANSLTLQGVASARNPPCGILTPSDGGKICNKKTVKDTKNSDENDQRFGANEDETGADNVENTEKMTDGEKEPVGIKVMEALEENFETHPEKINKLVYGHTNNDYVKEDIIEEKVTLEWSKKVSKKYVSNDTCDKEYDKLVMDSRLGVPAVSVKPTEGIGVCKDRATTHTPSKLFINESKIFMVIRKNTVKRYMEFIEDIGMYKDKLPNGMREIAETWYQLGVRHTEAFKYFNDAINILENMLQTLKVDTFDARVDKIDELELLLPEIANRIFQSAAFFVMDETDAALDDTVELYNETKLLRQFDPGISGDWSCSGLNFNPAVGNVGLVPNYVEAALGHARSWSAGEVGWRKTIESK